MSSKIGTSDTLYGEMRVSAAEQAEYESALYAKRITEIPSNMQMRVAYNADGTTLYAGYAPRGLAASTNGWLIQKFTYDASKRVTLRQIAYDNWDNKAGTAVYA